MDSKSDLTIKKIPLWGLRIGRNFAHWVQENNKEKSTEIIDESTRAIWNCNIAQKIVIIRV